MAASALPIGTRVRASYIRAMDALHRACVFTAGACLVIITIIVPWGVFTRYVLNSAASWPEPIAVLLMIVLSFLSAVVCYREYLHIGVGVLPALLPDRGKAILGSILEICMLATNLFMLWWGMRLVETTWYQSIAELPHHLGRHVVSADPDRRRDHVAPRDRALPDRQVLRRAGA